MSGKRPLILVHDETYQRRYYLKQKQAQEEYRRKMRSWYQNNKDWYSKYRKNNIERVREIYERYRKSDKGQVAIKRYEQSPNRKARKAFWNFRQNLELKVKRGEISKSTMYRLIKIRLREKPIPL